jgi:hypothetical protein
VTTDLEAVKVEASRAAFKGCGIGCLGVLGLVVFLGVLGALMAAGKDGNSKGPASRSAESLRYSACLVSHDFVKDRLKAPASAKFQNCGDATVVVTGSRYKVESHVDSQNSFGAMLRSQYVAIVDYQGSSGGEENWRLASIDIE